MGLAVALKGGVNSTCFCGFLDMAERVGGGIQARVIGRRLSSTCRLETCINKGDLRFEDLGSSEAAILKSQIRGGK